MKPARVALGAAMLLLAFGLGRISRPPAPEEAGPSEAQHVRYTCAMHPEVRQDAPGLCPICEMELIPLAEGAQGPPDRVRLSERARALARVRTTAVERRTDAAATLHLTGRVEVDETRLSELSARTAGRVERLLVGAAGERVRPGQVVAALYSPEVYAAHQDLISAARLARRLPADLGAEAAYAATRQRLRLLGLTETEVEEMAGAEQPFTSVTIRATTSGTVLERRVQEGAYVQVGAPLLRLADLRQVWVQLDLREQDLPRVAEGTVITFKAEALPGETFEGRVAFIDPTLDPQRRSARARVVVDNPAGLLRPGLYVEGAATVVAEGAPLVIPDTAPLFTGRRSIVYVELEEDGGPAYAPRRVHLGPRADGVYPVLAGLTEGERVVSQGAFALDADLQLRGGPSMMSAPDDLVADEAEPLALKPEERAALAPVVNAYLAVQRALADDALTEAAEAARGLASAVGAVTLPPHAEATWAGLSDRLAASAGALADAPDLAQARAAFLPLSEAVQRLLARLGNPTGSTLYVAHCPMANQDAGARWVQQGETIDNAYYGAAMLTCGSLQAEVGADMFLQLTDEEVTP